MLHKEDKAGVTLALSRDAGRVDCYIFIPPRLHRIRYATPLNLTVSLPCAHWVASGFNLQDPCPICGSTTHCESRSKTVTDEAPRELHHRRLPRMRRRLRPPSPWQRSIAPRREKFKREAEVFEVEAEADRLRRHRAA